MNILVTCNEAYLPYLNIMLSSLLCSNPDEQFHVYLLHSNVRSEALATTKELLRTHGRLYPIAVNESGPDMPPMPSSYPRETYYRFLAVKYLPPELERVLYLDSDLIVNQSLRKLYTMNLEDQDFAAAAQHPGSFLPRVQEIRRDMGVESPYLNSGVILMNLSRLRREQRYEKAFAYLQKQRDRQMPPDHNILCGLCGRQIHVLDAFRYNMTETLYQRYAPFDRSITLDWIREHTAIIHYCGSSKPWKEPCGGALHIFYQEAKANMELRLLEATGVHRPLQRDGGNGGGDSFDRKAKDDNHVAGLREP